MQAQFGDFCLDTDRRELSSRGVSIHVTPKALQLLQLLVERRPRVLGKEEIYEALWPGTFVEESNLSVLVAEVRAALGDEARRARFVKTAHGFGYGFIADVASTSTIRLRSGSREFELIEGD